MGMHRTSNRQLIEVRAFKWPRRPTSTAVACLLGEDTFGRWLGITRGDPWWAADRSRSGVFDCGSLGTPAHAPKYSGMIS
jgi:hypothetical protein